MHIHIHSYLNAHNNISRDYHQDQTDKLTCNIKRAELSVHMRNQTRAQTHTQKCVTCTYTHIYTCIHAYIFSTRTRRVRRGTRRTRQTAAVAQCLHTRPPGSFTIPRTLLVGFTGSQYTSRATAQHIPLQSTLTCKNQARRRHCLPAVQTWFGHQHS